MNNTGINLRSSSARKSNDPVIGDAFDLETYGRPTGNRHAARAHRPERVSTYRINAAAPANSAPANSVQAHSEPAHSEPAQSEPAQSEPAQSEPARSEPARSVSSAEVGDVPTTGAARTVKIKGQVTPARRRAAVQIERYDRRPDRAAQWALFMGVFMIVVAIVTGT